MVVMGKRNTRCHWGFAETSVGFPSFCMAPSFALAFFSLKCSVEFLLYFMSYNLVAHST